MQIFDIYYDLNSDSVYRLNQESDQEVVSQLLKSLSQVKVTISIDDHGVITLMALNDKSVIEDETVHLENGCIDVELMLNRS